MKFMVLSELLELSDSGIWGDEDAQGGISILRSTNFNKDGTLDLSKISMRAIEEKKRVTKILQDGDILLEKSGGGPMQPVGRVGLFKGDSRAHSFGNFIARLRPTSEVMSEYLFYYLWWFHSIGKTSHYQKQTTGIRNLEFKRYLSITVPIPSLTEQARVVDILSRAQSIVRLRNDARKKASKLIPAIFRKMFGDPESSHGELPMRKISDFVRQFQGGKNIQAGSDDPEGLRILKVSAVTSGRYLESESKPAPDDYKAPSSHFVKKGDMLFSRANTVELVGATALVESTDGKTLLPDKLWRIIWSQDVDVAYMHTLFQDSSVRRMLGKLATGTSDSMRNISQAKLFELQLPVAPLAEQRKFGVFHKQARVVTAQQEAALEKAVATFDALLAKAFH